MDRNAWIMSVGMVVFAIALAVYLAWNPRGMPRYGGWLFHDADTVRRSSPRFDPASMFTDIEIRSGTSVVDDAGRLTEHWARLIDAGLELTRAEIASVDGDTVFDAIALLRPYWLADELHAAVRIGGQLVGGVEVLKDIALSSVDMVRLQFSATEPHWIVQVLYE